MTYAEKLRSPMWQRRRLEVMARDGFKCTECGDGRRTLNVHHRWYERGVDPWSHGDECLTTLCEHCHELRTRVDDDSKRKTGALSREELVALLDDADRARNCVDVKAAWTADASRRLERLDAVKQELLELMEESQGNVS